MESQKSHRESHRKSQNSEKFPMLFLRVKYPSIQGRKLRHPQP